MKIRGKKIISPQISFTVLESFLDTETGWSTKGP